ncbi:MAG TPA: hypothetical protein VM328_01305 [Fimbriimonadaceae bacterium]|nr:hypothetical protein [Fimbriimonadaceae bacterium]
MGRRRGIEGRRFVPMFLVGLVVFMIVGFALTWLFGQMMGGPGPGAGVTPRGEVGRQVP